MLGLKSSVWRGGITGLPSAVSSGHRCFERPRPVPTEPCPERQTVEVKLLALLTRKTVLPLSCAERASNEIEIQVKSKKEERAKPK